MIYNKTSNLSLLDESSSKSIFLLANTYFDKIFVGENFFRMYNNEVYRKILVECENGK